MESSQLKVQLKAIEGNIAVLHEKAAKKYDEAAHLEQEVSSRDWALSGDRRPAGTTEDAKTAIAQRRGSMAALSVLRQAIRQIEDEITPLARAAGEVRQELLEAAKEEESAEAFEIEACRVDTDVRQVERHIKTVGERLTAMENADTALQAAVRDEVQARGAYEAACARLATARQTGSGDVAIDESAVEVAESNLQNSKRATAGARGIARNGNAERENLSGRLVRLRAERRRLEERAHDLRQNAKRTRAIEALQALLGPAVQNAVADLKNADPDLGRELHKALRDTGLVAPTKYGRLSVPAWLKWSNGGRID